MGSLCLPLSPSPFRPLCLSLPSWLQHLTRAHELPRENLWPPNSGGPSTGSRQMRRSRALSASPCLAWAAGLPPLIWVWAAGCHRRDLLLRLRTASGHPALCSGKWGWGRASHLRTFFPAHPYARMWCKVLRGGGIAEVPSLAPTLDLAFLSSNVHWTLRGVQGAGFLRSSPHFDQGLPPPLLPFLCIANLQTTPDINMIFFFF